MKQTGGKQLDWPEALPAALERDGGAHPFGGCGKLRSLHVERAEGSTQQRYRVSCQCDLPARSIRVVRGGVQLALEAFLCAQASCCNSWELRLVSERPEASATHVSKDR